MNISLYLMTLLLKKNQVREVREEELMNSQFSSTLAAPWPFGCLVKTTGCYRCCSCLWCALKLTATSLLRLVTQ